jgi:hypothetical protein
MPRIILPILILSVLSPIGYSWQIDFIDVANTGRFNSMVFDQNGLPLISYSENASPFQPEHLKLAVFNGTTWQIAVIDPELGAGFHNSLSLDSDGNPHIAYAFGGYGTNDLRYAHYTGSEWVIQTVDSPGDVGTYASIAVDSLNHPHISYYDNTNKALKYAYHDGHTWRIFSVESFQPTDSETGWTSIKTDKNDNPHIIYHDGGLCLLKYACWNGTNWDITIVDDVDAGMYGVSLALDTNQSPCIAYYDDASLKYASYESNIWQIAVVDTVQNDFTGLQPSLVLNSQGNPCISYEQEFNRVLKYACFQNSEWHISVVAAPISIVYYTSSLALDEDDNPHISFCYEAYRLAFAHHDQVGVELAYFTAQPAPAGGISLGWQTSSSTQGIVGFNLYRAVQSKSPKSDWAKLNSAPITGSNPYTYIDSSTGLGANYTYRLTSINAVGKEDVLGTANGTTQEIPTQFAITSIHPNPVANLLTCSYIQPAMGEVTFTIYDLSGRIVAESSQNLACGEGDAYLNTGSFANGVYTLRASSSNTILTKRFVVNH